MPTKYAPADLNTPKLLFEKLQRDRRRFKRRSKVQSDHIINFYVTAWHLTDWIWFEHVENDWNLRQRFGLHFVSACESDFQNWVCDDSGTPREPLIRCYLVATGSKHHTFRRKPRGFTATIDVSSGTVLSEEGLTFDLKKIDRDTGMPAGRVEFESDMDEIVKFWRKFFRTYLT
jgi:hypothetical protein